MEMQELRFLSTKVRKLRQNALLACTQRAYFEVLAENYKNNATTDYTDSCRQAGHGNNIIKSYLVIISWNLVVQKDFI